MNKLHVNAFLRHDFCKKDGSNPICVRIQIGPQKKVYSLNISVSKRYWDPLNQVIKPGPKHFAQNNIIINSLISRAKELVARAELDGNNLMFHDFDMLFAKKHDMSNSYYSFVENELVMFRNSISNDTYKMYKSQASKLKRFRPNLNFNEINPFFWKQYDNWLISIGNNENTRWKAFRTLKTFINKAIIQEIIKEDPLKLIRVRKRDGNREFLTLQELKILETQYEKHLMPHLKNTLRYFLFACYTGLRYTDIQNLKHSNIYDNTIHLTLHKTKYSESIPLHKKALKLINPGLPLENIFNVYTNQATNRNLKDIMTLAGIRKNISFHCARHTFATICLSLEIPISTVSKLLGHREIRTTQIYAKVLHHEKEKAMMKWDAV